MGRILVIDDSPTVVVALREALAPSGHEVETLEVFTDLAPAIRTRPPDLIVLDLEIPALSGLEMGRFVRRFEREHVPILIHSGRAETELREAAEALGAAGWVPKGLPPSELRRRVEAALQEEGRWTSASS